MQNGSPDGPSLRDERVEPPTDILPIEPPTLAPTLDSGKETLPELQTDRVSDLDGPPSKKRRLTDSTPSTPSVRAKSRPPSPPWKKIGVEGPTSFLDEGRRRSSRVNLIPQLQSEKRQTRTAHPLGNDAKPATSSPLSVTQLRVDANGKSGSKTSNGSPRVAHTKGATVKQQRISQSPKPPQSHKRSRSSITANRSRSSLAGASPRQLRDRQPLSTSSPAADNLENGNPNTEAHTDDCNLVIPRLKIKVRRPELPIRHPGHVSSKKYTSFREWIDNEDAPEVLSSEEALREAQRRNEVLSAVEPGGPLSSEVCSAYIEDVQDEPDPQYSHQDHLVAHALYFCKLMEKEHKRHRQMAKLCAQWCADAYRKRHKNPEDLLREQQEELRGKRKQLAKDLQRMFDLARAEIDQVRLAQWEEERKVQDQQALDRAIKKSTLLFEKRRSEVLGEMPSDALSSSEDDGETDYSSNASDGGNMSASESDSDEEGNVDDDATLTAEELRLKYSNIPEVTLDQDQMSVITASVFESEVDSTATPMEAPLDDGSDQSTDMDSDMGDDEDDEEEDDEEDSDNERNGLLAFFSTKKANQEEAEEEDNSTDDDDYEYKAPALELQSENEKNENDEAEEPDQLSLIPDGLSVPGTSTEATPMEIEEVTDDSEDVDMADIPMEEPSAAEDVASAELGVVTRPAGDTSSEPSPGTFATKPSEPESVSSIEPPVENALQGSHSPGPGLNTQIPHLLRGTLREYQHYGLDWLAGLYKNHINGILADEMGLGKTIQTIALLAHLAVDHGVWGPHLVVVPTSVILNWEMEFKKWCPGFKIMTYYGNQEERKIKRKGWTDDNSWNVLITSYQLALQDQISLKRRSWHYMVLDEAHNIKNFRSQRWQALLTFRTRARLLLTGTPLQNNLTELWSLLFFLMPTDGEGNNGIEGFADLRDFSEWFRRPVEQILEHGRETMDDEAKKVVTKLHTVLRPYILRRLKADVEKQMPGKYEHVVYCRLSKRQRFLYDGFMSMAQTKETLASGNFLSIIHCLMQLRKVCNHPDLFETRPISTSFAMPRSVVTDYNVKESLVRRRLLFDHPLTKVDLDFLNLAPVSREDISKRLADDSIRLMAFGPFKSLRELQYNRTNWKMSFDGSSMETILTSLENACRKRRMAELERCLYFESKRHGRRPVYGSSLFEFMRAGTSKMHALANAPLRKRDMAEWLISRSSVLASIILTVEERSLEMDGYVQRFACVTPAVVASGMTEAALTPVETRLLTNTAKEQPFDPFHEARMRLSIAFPDRRLLQYDCGKLQRLDKLLRDLKAGGHRALIFTQMTKMLDILEQFLNIHGHRYLRLDGTTKVEARQMLTERFNSDPRILAFILSSRSGGLGINLTGADTVIFYDLDWNPAMDKQCQDRCHRIGQTRDVHIYRFVSEYTIESNILRKANQKRMLDDVIIQEGEFTTDYFTKLDVQDPIADERDGKDEASAAMDRVLGNRVGSTRGFEQVEDKEDIDAAQNAEKELQHADDGDFEDRASHGTPAQTGTPLAVDDGTQPGAGADENTEVLGDIDDYILRFMWWNMRDEPVVPPMDKSKKRSKKGKEHNLKRRR